MLASQRRSRSEIVQAMISRSEQIERLRPLLAPAISLALIALAGFVIHRITEDIRVSEIRAAVQAIPLANVGVDECLERGAASVAVKTGWLDRVLTAMDGTMNLRSSRTTSSST